ncbi:MAG: DUF4242 domain-containing protein [Thaumarchaeota archaeon]|nr:DUF4242 domain-containing protein [Nitrososphaerota archaeon]
MPRFIDGHDMKDLTPDKLEKLANSPPDKFGVTHIELFYNKEEDRLYCILDAPNEEAIWKHHESAGLKCEFITEVQQIKTDKMIKSEKMIVLGEMSSRVSHDLRNPLSIIKNSLDLINMRYKDEMDKEMTDYVRRMDRAVSSINVMIGDIVNFAKTRPLMLENNSLLSTIHRVLDSVHTPDNIKIKIPQKDISFEFDLIKLEILFSNLITNAIHAIGEREGEISIKFDEIDHYNVQIQIADSGPGVPEELLPRIFEPLFTTKQYGTGLGLPSCKSIIEQHNGTISISNNPTTVTILLPKHQSVISAIKPDANQ